LADYNIVNLIDDYSPINQNIEINNFSPVNFSVSPINIGTGKTKITWTIDGAALAASSSQLELDAYYFGKNGDFVVGVLVEDAAGYVKNDPSSLSKQFIYWNVKVSADFSEVESEPELNETTDGDETQEDEIETDLALEDELPDYAENETDLEELTGEEDAQSEALFDSADNRKNKSDGCAGGAEAGFISLAILAQAALIVRRKKFSNR